MTHQEFIRLCGYSKAKKNSFRPATRVTSRRSAKSQGTGAGMILKSSRITNEVHLETIFNHPAWK